MVDLEMWAQEIWERNDCDKKTRVGQTNEETKYDFSAESVTNWFIKIVWFVPWIFWLQEIGYHQYLSNISIFFHVDKIFEFLWTLLTIKMSFLIIKYLYNTICLLSITPIMHTHWIQYVTG